MHSVTISDVQKEYTFTVVHHVSLKSG